MATLFIIQYVSKENLEQYYDGPQPYTRANDEDDINWQYMTVSGTDHVNAAWRFFGDDVTEYEFRTFEVAEWNDSDYMHSVGAFDDRLETSDGTEGLIHDLGDE